MPSKEPKFMQELHKIREELTKEWKGKSSHEIVSTIRKEAGKFKDVFSKATPPLRRTISVSHS